MTARDALIKIRSNAQLEAFGMGDITDTPALQAAYKGYYKELVREQSEESTSILTELSEAYNNLKQLSERAKAGHALTDTARKEITEVTVFVANILAQDINAPIVAEFVATTEVDDTGNLIIEPIEIVPGVDYMAFKVADGKYCLNYAQVARG